MTLDEIESEVIEFRRDPYLFVKRKTTKHIHALRLASHPDRHHSDTDRAKRIFSELGSLTEKANEPEFQGEYRLLGPVIRGDLCDVRFGRNDATEEEVVIKTSRVSATSLMRREVELLKKLASTHRLGDTIPKVVDTDGKYRTVLSRAKNHRELLLVGRLKRNAIDGRHIAWLFKRLLMTIGYVHSHGIVHGAVTPEHVLVDTDNHGITLVGWNHGGSIDSPIRVIPGRYVRMYPTPTLKSKKLTQSLDVSMAAQCCLKVAEEDLPWRISGFLTSCKEQTLFRDIPALELHADFDEIVRKTYGQPRFIHFT